MGLLISKSDFTGKYSLAKSSTDNIDSYIELHEEKFLVELLGIELFDLFKADVNVSTKKPNDPIYLDIYNQKTFKYDNRLYTSMGMKNILLGLIFFLYVRDNNFKQTQNGDVVNQTEVSSKANSSYLHIRYNESITSYFCIQLYCQITTDEVTGDKIYPDFDGICKRYSIPF